MSTLHYLSVFIVGAITFASTDGDGQTNSATLQNKPFQLTLELRDGSKLVGAPSIVSLPLRTEFAKMDLPLKLIETIEFTEDQQTVKVRFTNGDELKGVLNLNSIAMSTAFGKVSIPTAKMARISTVAGDVRRGRVLYYSFEKDESGKISDKGGHNNQGKNHGATWTPEGAVGGAMSFDGNSYIECANDDSLNVGKASFSVCFWIKASIQDATLISKHRGQAHVARDAGWNIQLENGPAPTWTPGIQVDYSDGENTDEFTVVTGNVADSTWHHVAVVFDRDARLMKGYLDGAPSQQRDFSKVGKISNETPLFIGWRGDFLRLRGGLDEIQIFDRALSAEEVRSLAKAKR